MKKIFLGINSIVLIIFAAYVVIVSNSTKQPLSHSVTSSHSPTTKDITQSSLTKNFIPTTTANGLYKDGTYSDIESTNWGDVKITVQITNGNLDNIFAPIRPASEPSEFALPILIQEQLSAGLHSKVDVITGATDISNAFSTAIVHITSQIQG